MKPRKPIAWRRRAAPSEIVRRFGTVYGKAEGRGVERIDVTSIADSVPCTACVAPGPTPLAQ